MKTRGGPRDSGFEEVWPPSLLDSNQKEKFLCGVSERDVNRSPHNKMQPLITSITSPGRPSRGPTASSGRGWRRPSLLRIIYSTKCHVYIEKE